MRRLLFGLMLFVGAALNANAGAKDYFSESEVDFGPTPRGPILTHYFIIKNTSKSKVTLGTARVSCGCVSASVLKSELAPDESTAVAAYMDTRRIPMANVLKTVLVYVPFLSPNLEEVTLKVQSIARDDLVFSPEVLAIGNVKKGKTASAKMKVTLFNHGNWNITEVASTGKFVTGTAKLLSRQPSEVTFEVTATLDENCPVGNWTSDLYLKTNAVGLEKVRVPVTVNVTTAIAVTPEEVKVGEIKEGSKLESKLMLQGSQNFKILEVKGGDDEVAVKSESSESRALHTLLFAIKPTKAGDLNRSFEVLTDHKEMPKVTIPFTAKVVK
ncbi:DUF1573 domain-containing protein [Limnoglobus roseus]|uniref:DUF1573 domain-containing protein n=1 Tax=Limnoglobus roseus TaxID=2598579 RepID=A0A5C1AHW8_9BACT|nr:DUF1573 domain-containing protein [Limnoglobus roseus]QEL18430.1 hypothetical protein PX52LOC_05455 [Limnoglobus roseus]